MKYKEISVSTLSEAEELVSNVFFEQGLDAVSIMNVEDVIKLKAKKGSWDYMDEHITDGYGKEVIVKGFCKLEDFDKVKKDIICGLEELKGNSLGIFNLGSLEMISREIEGDDWINVWKKHFKPIHIKKVVVCPKWIEYKKADDEKLLKIDVGMAFGTGEHETTSMCIELMQDYDLTDKTVFDVGCGSGILGIAACLLGAKKVVMSDIDEIAVKAAKENSRLNGVFAKTEITERNLLDGETSNCDLLVSNITADILVKMTKEIATALNCGKTLILSGIIKDRLNEVLTEFGKVGFSVTKQLEKGEWYALTFIKE